MAYVDGTVLRLGSSTVQREGSRQQRASIAPCFLIVDLMLTTASLCCQLDFSVMVDWTLELWGRRNHVPLELLVAGYFIQATRRENNKMPPETVTIEDSFCSVSQADIAPVWSRLTLLSGLPTAALFFKFSLVCPLMLFRESSQPYINVLRKNGSGHTNKIVSIMDGTLFVVCAKS